MSGERGLFADPIPPEKRAECRVAVPTDKDCYALANSFRQLSDQLLDQRGRRFSKIRLHPTGISVRKHNGYIYRFLHCKQCGQLVELMDYKKGER